MYCARSVENLKLSGTIYGGWISTEGAVMQFRLLDYKIFDVGQRQGYFDLFGRWRGSELVMDDRGESSSKFRSGLKIDTRLGDLRLRQLLRLQGRMLCRQDFLRASLTAADSRPSSTYPTPSRHVSRDKVGLCLSFLQKQAVRLVYWSARKK